VGVLVSAWRELAADGATLCLAGEGPLRGAEEAGLRYLGHVKRETLPVAYAAADLVVVPSLATRRFLEPWGLVCNEAMYGARPVIASAAVGAVAGGLVKHGQTGMVVRAGDESDLVSAMRQLLGDPALRVRLGDRGRVVVGD
jgi:glycosyltransferase involved in cell wall biosynthesis